MVLRGLQDHSQWSARRRRRVMASITVVWVVVFLCAALIATTANESRERAQIEAQIRATQAQNAALQKDIQQTRQALDIARSRAEIIREAHRWGYH